ncbi:MAG: hypothetical protein LC748_13070, partial [Thermomicrobia bacterium]|nr:hypothetical protein [Thermomicrobia bacterium]
MPPLAMTFAPARTYQRLLWLAMVTMLLPLLLAALPPLVHREQAAPNAPDRPVEPVAPTTQKIPPGLGPILNATLAADSAEDYAVTPLAAPDAGLHANNPAQRFAMTFGSEGVQVVPATGTPFSMHATAISTTTGSIPVTAEQPTIAGSRVEYRHDGMTEWYVNGPRGLEQGFTLPAAPAGAAQFT